MKLKAYTNTGKKPVHIGGKMIMPGNTREVDETLHPDYETPQKEAAPKVDALAELLALPIKKIIPQLDALSDEDLARLDIMEHDKKESDQRKTLTAKIAEIQMDRAKADSEMDQFAESLPLQDDDSLGELAVLHKDDAQLMALINAEIDRRTAADNGAE